MRAPVGLRCSLRKAARPTCHNWRGPPGCRGCSFAAQEFVTSRRCPLGASRVSTDVVPAGQPMLSSSPSGTQASRPERIPRNAFMSAIGRRPNKDGTGLGVPDMTGALYWMFRPFSSRDGIETKYRHTSDWPPTPPTGLGLGSSNHEHSSPCSFLSAMASSTASPPVRLSTAPQSRRSVVHP